MARSACDLRIDSEEDRAPEHTVEIDHTAELAIEGVVGLDRAAEVDLPMEVQAAAASEQWTASPRPHAGLLTALSHGRDRRSGLVSRERVESAIETSPEPARCPSAYCSTAAR